MSTASKHFQPFMMAEERAARSVFVGNIPYEATEEQLKEIFAQAGPVVSFRLVYDRETGKPKGYGFCEYQDVETAQSAMRNLNNHDFNGRPLRVGVAAGEQTKDENRAMQQALGGAVSESPYGEPVDPEKAPEAISRAVASLPPEQMFELMKQMKLCIQNNPNEARNMLLQNPQLAYALLQAQIVMKIVDPQVALAMLHRQTEQIPPVMPSGNSQAFQHQNSNSMMAVDNKASVLASSRTGFPASVSGGFSVTSGVMGSGNRSYRSESSPIDAHEVMIDQQNLVSCDRRETLSMERHSMPVKDWQDFQIAPRRDLPFSVGHGLSDTAGAVSGLRNSESKVEMVSKLGLGSRPGYDSGSNQRLDISTSRMLSGAAGVKQDNLQTSRQEQQLPSCKTAVRENEPAVNSRVEVAPEIRDPRQAAEIRRSIVSQGPTSRLTMPILGPSVSSANSVSAHDQEKAALIMQVLQLSDEQIAMLPEDQRQSIMILKEQIARSAN